MLFNSNIVDLREAADCINVLGGFLGKRDVPFLDSSVDADAMVLFGGTILAGADVLASAMKNSAARKFIVSGGAGHTTDALRKIIHDECPDIETENKTEAEILNMYIMKKHGLSADYLETCSTNCGNNITFLLRLMEEKNIPCNKIILCQDATMQTRMSAVLSMHAPKIQCVNYASYSARVIEKNEKLEFESAIKGMWSVERYVDLLMGEIPRLRDDENGYGPKGKNFLVHVDIPAEVLEAFTILNKKFGIGIREANPKFGL